MAKKPDNKPKKSISFYWIYGIIAVAFLSLQIFNFNSGPKEITQQEFEKNMLRTYDVEKIIIVNKETAEIYIKKDSLNKEKFKDISERSNGKSGPHYIFSIGDVQNFEKRLEEIQTSFPENYKISVQYIKKTDWTGELLSWLIPIAIFIGFWIFLIRRMGGGSGGGGQIFNFGKSKAKLFDQEGNQKITFADVAGLEEAKVEVMEIVDFLKNPKKYTELGGKIPKGALLVGPPGTGKTLLAKAVAGEAQVPFFSLSGSDFVEMFVGVGASRVRDLFKQAKEKAPCIVFIDEIDAIGRARGKSPITGGNDERESTLNQLLTEMDGFATNAGVIILAATNRADILDRALLRAGRFDRQIHVELPDIEERKAIFKVHLKPIKLKTGIDEAFLSKQTPGFSGADIANVCNEAALIAARKNKTQVEKQDFLDAVDRIIGGLEKKNKLISPKEKKVIAYHESGHASISWLLPYAHPLVKVTIIPRGKALGAAWYLPEERQLSTKAQMMDEICSILGGRAAEETFFSEISTGALNDLERVTKLAYAMVSIYGLNDKIGNLSYYDSTGQSEYSFSKPYSNKTSEIIDEEVSKIIESAYTKAKFMLEQNKDRVSLLAERLLTKEVIFREDLEEIFGPKVTDEQKKPDIFSGFGDNDSTSQTF